MQEKRVPDFCTATLLEEPDADRDKARAWPHKRRDAPLCADAVVVAPIKKTPTLVTGAARGQGQDQRQAQCRAVQ